MQIRLQVIGRVWHSDRLSVSYEVFCIFIGLEENDCTPITKLNKLHTCFMVNQCHNLCMHATQYAVSDDNLQTISTVLAIFLHF